MSGRPPSGRLAVAGIAAVIALAIAGATATPSTAPRRPPDVIVILTDDQGWDTLEAMPWLHAQLEDPASGWASSQHAFATSPLCCPARASLLTGRYPRHTGVLHNEDGDELDDSQTLATWLHDAGYRTGLVGKYLNLYPFGRAPFVPPGWDRWVAKENVDDSTVYGDFDVIDQGSAIHVGNDYATDWLADRAVGFVHSTPRTQPMFLLFAPSAPHSPWIPAPRDVGADASLQLEEAPTVLGALRGAPPWVRALPLPSAAQRAEWLDERRRERETLRAVDEAIRRIVTALGDRLRRAAIFVLSDQGYSFGEHRWEGKRCPYEACVRIPFVVRSPWGTEGVATTLISTVDLAPTILRIAGVAPEATIDGVDVSASLGAPGAPPRRPEAVFLEWPGDVDVPSWEVVRTADLKLVRYADGFEELYDVGGRLGPADPWERDNRIDDPAYGPALEELRSLLGRHPGRR